MRDVAVEVGKEGTFCALRADGSTGFSQLTQLDLDVVLKSVIEAALQRPGLLGSGLQGDEGHESEHQGPGKWNGRFQFAHGQN